MARTETLTTRRLASTVGAEVLGVDRDRLLADEALPGAVAEALERHGVLLFRGLDVDDATQVEFCRRLGEPILWPRNPIPEIFEISLNPENPYAEYLHGTIKWHIDGTIDQKAPAKATVLTAKIVVAEGGETEFASTYAAYDDLSEDEQARFTELRVFHSLEAAMRDIYPDPTPEQREQWAAKGGKEQALVWTHRTGRRSLVLGETADYIVGMDVDEGRALLAELLGRATTSDRIYRHRWAVGDLLMWDNTGVLHRREPYDPGSRRELHRTMLEGDEPIQ
jgi:alpha-ketoglutarate-dependent taurine dioxygenase